MAPSQSWSAQKHVKKCIHFDSQNPICGMFFRIKNRLNKRTKNRLGSIAPRTCVSVFYFFMIHCFILLCVILVPTCVIREWVVMCYSRIYLCYQRVGCNQEDQCSSPRTVVLKLEQFRSPHNIRQKYKITM